MSGRQVLLALFAAVIAALPAAADDLSRFSILEENDSLWFNSDQHYTQGIRFSELGPDLQPDSAWNAPFFLFDLFGSASEEKRRYSVELGQNIFTPTNRYLAPPDPPRSSLCRLGLYRGQSDAGG